MIAILCILGVIFSGGVWAYFKERKEHRRMMLKNAEKMDFMFKQVDFRNRFLAHRSDCDGTREIWLGTKKLVNFKTSCDICHRSQRYLAAKQQLDYLITIGVEPIVLEAAKKTILQIEAGKEDD